jgi:tetratricopeptide (TPR) repeat protein
MKRNNQNASSETFNQRGIDLADRGWLDEALREFGMAIEADSSSPFPRLNRASVLLEQERNLEALEDLLAAIHLAPDEPATRYHLGVFLTRVGPELAMEQFSKALDQDPEHIDVLIQMGIAKADRGELGEAEKYLRRAFEIDDSDPLVNRELGMLLMERGSVHDAIGHLKVAQACIPDDPEYLIDLGMAYIQAGFYEQAERVMIDVIGKDSTNFHAHYNLAAIYADWGKTEASCEHLALAAQREPQRVGEWARDDRMFDKIRTDHRFRKLIETSKLPDVG